MATPFCAVKTLTGFGFSCQKYGNTFGNWCYSEGYGLSNLCDWAANFCSHLNNACARYLSP